MIVDVFCCVRKVLKGRFERLLCDIAFDIYNLKSAHQKAFNSFIKSKTREDVLIFCDSGCRGINQMI
jgi:hypothetical protein